MLFATRIKELEQTVLKLTADAETSATSLAAAVSERAQAIVERDQALNALAGMIAPEAHTTELAAKDAVILAKDGEIKLLTEGREEAIKKEVTIRLGSAGADPVERDPAIVSQVDAATLRAKLTDPATTPAEKFRISEELRTRRI